MVKQEPGFVTGFVGNVEEEAVPEAAWFDGALLGGFFRLVVELQVVVATGEVEVDFGGGFVCVCVVVVVLLLLFLVGLVFLLLLFGW